jgi:hypothetical protein
MSRQGTPMIALGKPAGPAERHGGNRRNLRRAVRRLLIGDGSERRIPDPRFQGDGPTRITNLVNTGYRSFVGVPTVGRLATFRVKYDL